MFIIENKTKLDQMRYEVNSNLQATTNDTRTVFDAVMKDIDNLQNEMAKVTFSSEISELETHLSERIASYAETSL